jgi:hypothetical protein
VPALSATERGRLEREVDDELARLE